MSCVRKKHPKWHDGDCYLALKSLNHTSQLLKNKPNDPWLRGKLITENKKYKHLMKLKHKQFISSVFSQLESMYNAEPLEYYNLVNL